MKLFLASSLDKTISLFSKKLTRPIKGRRVIFITNAADNHKGDKWWIKFDKDAFIKIGCNLVEVDMRQITKKDFKSELEKSDIIHFCGGSVLHLISVIKKRNFSKLIINAVRKDKIIYSGTSAGSMIVAKDLSLNAFEPDEKQYLKETKDYSGLGLVNFMVMPHCNNKYFVKGNKKMIENLSGASQALIFIYDNQAVWVEDDKLEVVSV